MLPWRPTTPTRSRWPRTSWRTRCGWPAARHQAAPQEDGRDIEAWKEKGVALRAFFYIFGTHLFAGLIWLLFHVGQHANK
ncbi:DUF6126 family protein [Streptomyces sp. NBC_00846]|uniref:DUF6126 family protein n=1 Tax=Streptomyces sp. NBC_00846 TaxID=2975849 RepID=UPI00386760FC|nr:DUF6126 family protein [Streptomyces sp. NBC_00846]